MKRRAADGLSIVGLLLAVGLFDGRWLGNRLPRGEDHWLAFLPAYHIGEGHWPPRWNPFVCGGAPQAANPQYSAWYPPRWVFCFVPALKAYGPYCFGHFVLAALAMFVCLRWLSCGPPAAMVGALSFACGSYIQGHLSNPGLLFSSVWLPLVVACSFRAFERPGLNWPTWLGLLMAIVVFAGSPHNIFYAALIVALVAVWKGGMGWRVAGHLAWAMAVALGVSAVQWIPTFEFARLSFRHTLSLNDLARDPLAWSWLDNLFLGSPVPWPTEYLDKSTYFGMSVLPLVLLALVIPVLRGNAETAPSPSSAPSLSSLQSLSSLSSPRRLEWFFVLLALVGVWIALGTQAGAFHLLGQLPVVRFLSGPSRALALFSVATSALVGLGADVLLRNDNWRKRRTFWWLIAANAALAAYLFLANCWRLTWSDLSDLIVHATTPRDLSLFPAINGAVFLALGTLLLAAAGLLPARFRSTGGIGLAIALLLVLDLFHFRRRLPLPESAREDLAPPDTAAFVLRDSSRPFHVVGYEPTRLHPGDMNACGLREFLMPNLAAFYGLQDVQGFDPLILRDYARLVEATAGRSPTDDPVRMLNLARPDRTLFRLLNVRYVVGDVRERRIAEWPTPKNGLYRIALDAPTTFVGVSLVTLLDRAQEVALGTTVALVVARGDSPTTGKMPAPPSDCTAAIRAGIETADWRAADTRFFCRHPAAQRNMAWTVLTPSGPVTVANYYAQVTFDRPVAARAIEIRPTVPGIAFVIATVAAVLPEPPGWEKVFERDRYRIYRNREALGGAWLVHQVRSVADENEALDLLAKGDVDVAREAVVAAETEERFKFQVSSFKSKGSGGVGANVVEGSSPDRVEFVRYEADRIEVRTESAQPALLCFAEVFYPGWTAQVDGGRADVVRVNFLLRGVVLPTGGRHSVTLHFAPRSLAVGKIISAIALLVALATVLLHRTNIPHKRRGAGC